MLKLLIWKGQNLKVRKYDASTHFNFYCKKFKTACPKNLIWLKSLLYYFTTKVS